MIALEETRCERKFITNCVKVRNNIFILCLIKVFVNDVKGVSNGCQVSEFEKRSGSIEHISIWNQYFNCNLLKERTQYAMLHPRSDSFI